jgi:hypothetical protein
LAMLEQRMGPKGLGRHFSTYLTEITFVQKDAKGQPMAYPQMHFFAEGPLTRAQLVPIKAMRNDPQCQRITGEAGVHGARAIAPPAVVNEAAFIAPREEQRLEYRGPLERPTTIEATAVEEDTGLGSFGVTTASPSVTIGAGGQAVVIPPQTTVADTGEPEESDAELDARIKGILGKAK